MNWRDIERKLCLPACIAMTTLSVASALPTDYFVDDSVPMGASHDGGSWMTAFETLEDALAVAVNGDRIFLAHGTYRPGAGTETEVLSGGAGDPRSRSFALVNGVTVRGGFKGLDPGGLGMVWDLPDGFPQVTVLSGDSDTPHTRADDCYNVVHAPGLIVPNGSGSALTQGLERVTVRDGNANVVGTGALHYECGGGLYCGNQDLGGGRVRLEQCLFLNNYAANRGGASYFEGFNGELQYFGAVQCYFAENEAGIGGGALALLNMGRPTLAGR